MMPRITPAQMQGNALGSPPGFCTGCGYYLHVHGEHRDDCTTPPEKRKSK